MTKSMSNSMALGILFFMTLLRAPEVPGDTQIHGQIHGPRISVFHYHFVGSGPAAQCSSGGGVLGLGREAGEGPPTKATERPSKSDRV
jgi:hypothetical protein